MRLGDRVTAVENSFGLRKILCCKLKNGEFN
jgi:hypothetical protein